LRLTSVVGLKLGDTEFIEKVGATVDLALPVAEAKIVGASL
jgi:hypothetical protein